MKLNFDKEFMIKAFIVVIILSFFFSMIAMAFRGDNGQKNDVPTEQDVPTILIGQGNVILNIREYSGILELNRINDESREFVMEGVHTGEVLYFNEEENKVSIVLADRTKTYDYAKQLMDYDPSVSMILNVRVYSDEKFDFQTDDGQIISALVPESEIKISYPYKLGEVLYYSALVQLYDGNIVGAQLYPLTRKKELEIPVIINEKTNEYYSRLFFNWRDRETARLYSSNLNETLTEIGAENVLVNYISDVTIYANRPLNDDEIEMLYDRFSDLKTVKVNKIVFHDHSNKTEQEISEYIYNITNGTMTLDFSPPMLEFVFEYDGEFNLVNDVLSDMNDLSIVKYYLNVGNLETVETSLIVGETTYSVSAFELKGYVPADKEEGDKVSILVDASIQANNIFNAEQILEFSFE